ncbi:MAG: hypothetical protein AB1806_18350 [Acidobacteriota bacterium]
MNASVRSRTVGSVAIAAIIFAFSWLLRFNDPGGAYAGLTDDHFFYLVRGWQILFGDLPVRDFVDHGAPLFYYVGAAVQWLGGRGTLPEIVFCVTALSVGAAATYWLAARASGSRMLGVAAALFQILLEPRFYNYPKILVYVVAIPALWAFADRPTLQRSFWIALVTVIGSLFRHDHGVFVALSMAALLIFMKSVGWRDRARHACLYALMVIALLSPYVLFVQMNGGMTAYLKEAYAWAERDRERAPVKWPGLMDNPDGISGDARHGDVLTRPVAVIRDNRIAWLYYLEIAVPFLALGLMGLASSAGRQGWPNAAAKISTVAVMGIVLNAGFLRGPLGARLADPSVPHAILLAWIVAATVRMVRGGSAALQPPAAKFPRVTASGVGLVVLALVTLLAVTLSHDLRRRLDKARLLDGPSKAVDRAGDIAKAFASTWPLERWTEHNSPRAMDLTFYLRDCTRPADRVFVAPYLPQVIALSQRAFAGGHADLRPGFFRSTGAQKLTIERIRRQSVPIVVLAGGEGHEGFRGSFPLIIAYLDEQYLPAGERILDGNLTLAFFVSKSVSPVRRYEPLDLPCFR